MSVTVGSLGKVMKFLPILLVEVLNPLFVISVALYVGLGYILTLLTSVDISLWQSVFLFSVLLPFTLLLLRAKSIWNGAMVEEARSTWRQVLPFIPLLFLLPVFTVELAHPDLQLPGHGDLHVGYTLQLIYGTTPIESVFLAGYPANYYWLYHAYLAVLVSITSLSTPTIGSIVNLLAILSSLLWIAQTLIVLRLARPRTVYLGLLAILVYCSVNMTGVVTLVGKIVEEENVLRTLRFMLLEGADRRLHSVLGKALNFGSMTLGLMFFAAALYATVRLIQRRNILFSLILISASGIAGLAIQQMATLYIVVVLLGGAFLTGLVSLVNGKSMFTRVSLTWRELVNNVNPLLLLLWLVISLCLSMPLLIYINRFSSVNNVGFTLRFFSEANIAMLVAALMLYLPFFLIQTVFAMRSRIIIEKFIVWCSILGLLLTSILNFPDSNQYKGVFFLAILLALLALFALNRLSKSSYRLLRYSTHLVISVFLILTFSRIVWINHFYIQKARISQFEYEGTHLVFHAGDDDQFDASYWIREHTPPDSVVIYPVQSYRYMNTFHERLPYVKKKQYTFVENMPAYDERVQRLSVFYSADTSRDDYRRILAEMENELPGRSLYAVVHNSVLAPDLMAQRSAVPVFAPEGSGTYVYQLNPGEGA